MSWATCYSSSNNIHFDFPPIMSDGRIHSSWQPASNINDQIKKSAGINNNWQYRQYLQNNASSIIQYNSTNYCNELGLPRHIYTDKNVTTNIPHRYKSTFDTTPPAYGYHQSDLKNPYLSRQQLQARKSAPPVLLYN
jgi:hypothetical protein